MIQNQIKYKDNQIKSLHCHVYTTNLDTLKLIMYTLSKNSKFNNINYIECFNKL